jgi:hypothetical protein
MRLGIDDEFDYVLRLWDKIDLEKYKTNNAD